jgi:hypothetical protein
MSGLIVFFTEMSSVSGLGGALLGVVFLVRSIGVNWRFTESCGVAALERCGVERAFGEAAGGSH